MGFTTEDIFGSVFGPQAPGTAPRPGFPELLLGAVGSASQDARSPIARGLGAFSGVLGQQLGTERNDPQAAFLRQLQAIPFEPVQPTQERSASLSASISPGQPGVSGPTRIGPSVTVPPPPAGTFREEVSRVPPGQERRDLFSLAGPKGLGISSVFRPPTPVTRRPGDIPGVVGPAGKFQQTGPQIPPSKLRTPSADLFVNKEGRYMIKAIDQHGAVEIKPTGQFAPSKGRTETQSQRERRNVSNLKNQFDTVAAQLAALRKDVNPPRALLIAQPVGPKRDKARNDWLADRQKAIDKLVGQIRNISNAINKITKANPGSAPPRLNLEITPNIPQNQSSVLDRGRQIAGG